MRDLTKRGVAAVALYAFPIAACVVAMMGCKEAGPARMPPEDSYTGNDVPSASGGEPPAIVPEEQPLRVGFSSVTDPNWVATGGGSTGSSSGGTTSNAIVPPFGVSTNCGDAIVGADEECDDGDSGSDACTSQCRTRDQVAVSAYTGADRYLGVGRHPLAGLDGGFIATFTEVANVAASGEGGSGGAPVLDERAKVNATLFDIWGKKQHFVQVSDGASPVDDANPVAAALPGGDYAVAWSDFDGDGSDLGIALRRVKSDGTLGSLMAANAQREFSQRNPDMIWTGTELIVAWEDFSDAFNGPDIRYRRFDGNLRALSGDLTLAGGPTLEAAVSLAPFGSGWAAAYREQSDSPLGREYIVVRAGAKTFRIGNGGDFAGGPITDRPALAELDATHLLVVVSVGTDPFATGVYNVPRLRYAVVDTESVATPTLQALDPMDDLLLSDAFVSHSSPALAKAEDGVYLAWRSEARPSDAASDQVWVKRVTFNPMFTPPKLLLGEPEVLMPRACEGSMDDQRAPALAPVPLPPHGAMALAWDDYGHTQGALTGDPDVVVQYAPIHPPGGTAPKYVRETWTAANGAAWPSRWSLESQPVPSTLPTIVNINYGTGRIATSSTTTSNKSLAWISDENALNSETKVKFRLSANNTSAGLIVRRADEDPDSYLRVFVTSLGQPLKLEAVIDGGMPIAIASLTMPYLFNAYVQGLDWFVKLRVVTNADASITLSTKVWLADLSEPAAWMLVGQVPGTGTSAIRSRLGARAGRFGVFAEQGAVSRTVTFDNFQAMFLPGTQTGSLNSDQLAPPPFPRDMSADSCCATDSECGGLSCSASMNASLHLGSNQTACVPNHCTNEQLDSGLGETGVDCGGPDCGACSCERLPRTCSAECPCGIGQGDCGTSDSCFPGLVCRQMGWRYGLPSNEDDVCVPFHCFNRVQDADKGELGPDWGGECGLQCDTANQLGSQEHCTVSCVCGRGGGDCDGNDQCQPGMYCTNKGPTFGVAYNVCVAIHCTDKLKNFDETGIDCGGVDCGPICP